MNQSAPILPFALGLVLALTGRPAHAQSTTRVSVTSEGLPGSSVSRAPRVSEDGRFVVFTTNSLNFVPGTFSPQIQVYVHDRITGITELVSSTITGGPGTDTSALNEHGSVSTSHAERIVFWSRANTLVANDVNGAEDVFLRDRIAGTTTLLSTNAAGQQGNGHSELPTISSDGNLVAFQSMATNLVPNDTNQKQDIFVKNLTTGAVVLASVGLFNGFPGGDSSDAVISGDGRWVAYASDASNIVQGDGNNARDIFIRDLLNATTERISRSSAGAATNLASETPSISADGSRVVFQSDATNLVPNDTNGFPDVFLRDRTSGLTLCLSLTPTGATGNGYSMPYSISPRGRYVGFNSGASNLVAGDANGNADAFRYDVNTGTMLLLSSSSGGAPADSFSDGTSLSGAGDVAAFESFATNLIAGDANGLPDVFVRDLHSPASPITSYCTPKTSSGGCIPAIGTSGLASVTGLDSFRLCAGRVPVSVLGLFLCGKTPSAQPFHGGTLCLAPPLGRSPASDSGFNNSPGACSGACTFTLGAGELAARGFIPGDVGYAQFWFRDPGFPAPDNVGLSDAVTFTVEP